MTGGRGRFSRQNAHLMFRSPDHRPKSEGCLQPEASPPALRVCICGPQPEIAPGTIGRRNRPSSVEPHEPELPLRTRIFAAPQHGAALGLTPRRALCLVRADRDWQPLVPQGSPLLPRKAQDCVSVHKRSPVSSTNAQRRHAKATRRKKTLDQRRRLEVQDAGGELAREVRRAAAAPLHACLMQDSVFQSGVGMVFLSRKTGARDLALGGFLVDAYCLGVKDAMYRELDESEMEELLEGAGATAPLAPVDPSYARKLLRDATAYARSLGLPPHPDYASVELMFGDVAADACDVEFQFGCEGRPLYVPGPTESPTQIRRRIRPPAATPRRRRFRLRHRGSGVRSARRVGGRRDRL